MEISLLGTWAPIQSEMFKTSRGNPIVEIRCSPDCLISNISNTGKTSSYWNVALVYCTIDSWNGLPPRIVAHWLCWFILNWNLRNKLDWNLDENTGFLQQNGICFTWGWASTTSVSHKGQGTMKTASIYLYWFVILSHPSSYQLYQTQILCLLCSGCICFLLLVISSAISEVKVGTCMSSYTP